MIANWGSPVGSNTSLNSDNGAVTPLPCITTEEATMKKWTPQHINGISSLLMNFFVQELLGNNVMSSQNGWGKKVATEKTEWIGSGGVSITEAAAFVTDEEEETTAVNASDNSLTGNKFKLLEVVLGVVLSYAVVLSLLEKRRWIYGTERADGFLLLDITTWKAAEQLLLLENKAAAENKSVVRDEQYLMVAASVAASVSDGVPPKTKV
jgi:hypothetical protein